MAEIIFPIAVYYAILLTVSWIVQAAAPSWPGSETLGAALSAALVLVLLLPAYKKDRQKPDRCGLQETAGKEGSKAAPGWFPAACFFAGGAFNFAFSRLMEAAHFYEYFPNDAQAALLSAAPALKIIGLGLLVPAAEELAWRGLFYQRLKNRIPGIIAALIGAGLFAAGHGNVIQALYAFPSSLIMIWCLERGETLLCPVLFHCGANLLAVIFSLCTVSA